MVVLSVQSKLTLKYFSWGDTIGKNKNGSGSYNFSDTNYNAGICGAGYYLNKPIPQGNISLDAARSNIGSPWKMPTITQSRELINGTNHTWTTMTGMNGRKFTSKKDSTKYIFLPAGGFWNYTSLFDAGSFGYYWTTTITDTNSSNILQFYNNRVYEADQSRYRGLSVRAK